MSTGRNFKVLESGDWGWRFFWCALNNTKDDQIIPFCPKRLDPSVWCLGQHSSTAGTCVQPPCGDPTETQAGAGTSETPKAPHLWPPLMRAALQSTMSLLLPCFSLHSGSCWLYSHPETQPRRAKLNIYTGNPDPLLLIGMTKGAVAIFHVYVSRICLENISWPDE